MKGESSLPSKEKVSFADTAKIYGKKEPSIPETVKKEKEICACFAVTPQTAKVTARVSDKCLVKIEKALNLWVKDLNRKQVSICGFRHSPHRYGGIPVNIQGQAGRDGRVGSQILVCLTAKPSFFLKISYYLQEEETPNVLTMWYHFLSDCDYRYLCC